MMTRPIAARFRRINPVPLLPGLAGSWPASPALGRPPGSIEENVISGLDHRATAQSRTDGSEAGQPLADSILAP